MARLTAIITGCSTGIGCDLAKLLAKQGYALTLLDIDVQGAQRTAAEVKEACGVVCAVERLDVTDTVAQTAAIQRHVQRYGRLDVAVLNAGIGERGMFLDAGNSEWQRTLDVDLTAVLHGLRSSALAMQAQQPAGGTIICVASAGAIFPMPSAPVYAAAKSGLVHLVRSLGPSLHRKGVRVMAVCPEFVDTPLVRRVMEEDPVQARRLLGSLDVNLLPPAAVSSLILQLLQGDQQGGSVALLRQDRTVQFPFAGRQATKGGAGKPPLPAISAGGKTPQPAVMAGSREADSSGQRAARAAWARPQGDSYRKWQVQQLSSDFRQAARLVTATLPPPIPAGHLLVRRVYVGCNASDINFSAGRYFGSPRAAAARLPFDCGFESVSVVTAVGQGVTGISPGDSIASLTYDGFAEYATLPAAQALKIPSPRPEVVALLTSGLTASIALEQCASLAPGQTVLVTAAAGGTGQFAVQLARLAGCHVVATAGGPDKVALCRQLGAHRVVDYKSEQLKDVLKKEYPKGVDVVYESVGGDMFQAAVDNLADCGRLIIIGMMSQYADGWPGTLSPGLPEKLLWKSASMHGFFLLRYASQWRLHLSRLLELWQSGQLAVNIDPTPFIGMESVPAAVEHLQSGRSVGKVVVQVPCVLPEGAAIPNNTPTSKM